MLDMMKISSGNDIFTDIPGNEQCQRIVKVFLYHLLLYPVRLLIMMTTLKKIKRIMIMTEVLVNLQSMLVGLPGSKRSWVSRPK